MEKKHPPHSIRDSILPDEVSALMRMHHRRNSSAAGGITKKKHPPHSIRDSIVPDEISALIRYASERGFDKEGKILPALTRTLGAYKAAQAVGATLSPVEIAAPAEELLKLYSQLAALTYPVNGRTLLDTERVFGSLGWILFWTLVFLFLGVGNKILALWLGDIHEPEEGWLLRLVDTQRYVLDYLGPFFWGGLGSCVFLLKTLSDKAADRVFDRQQLRGWGTRIMLGAVLGAVVQYIYNPESFTTQAFKLDASAIAFFTGVGVKVVYGAIEKTIDVLAGKMNLEAIRRARPRGETIAAYLGQQLVATKEPAKRELLQQIIDAASKRARD